MVNGIVGWAAFRLKRGAYKAMEAYARGCWEHAEGKFLEFKKRFNYEQLDRAQRRKVSPPPPKVEDPYSGRSFNCMTFALNVYAQGRNPEKSLATNCTNQDSELDWQVDHPNDHIEPYMQQADDKAYYDDRKYRGVPEAVTNHAQGETKIIRHHTAIALES